MNNQNLKNRKTKIIGIFFFIICIGIVMVFGMIRQGWFLSREDKILLAAANTMKESVWRESMTESGLLDAEEVTAAFHWQTLGANMKAELGLSESETGVSFNAGFLGLSLSLKGIITEDTLKMQIPLLGDTVFYHTFQEGEDNPFFEELFGARAAQDIDEGLRAAAGFRWHPVSGEFSVAEIREQLKSCGWKKVEDADFIIDKKEVSCKGYEGQLVATAQKLSEDNINGNIRVYIYKNKIAAVMVDTGEHSYELRFLGGKTRDQEVELSIDDSKKVNIKAVEDEETGKVKVIYSDEQNTRIAMKGTVTADGLKADIVSASYRGKDSKLEGTFSLTPGADISLPKGNTVDFEKMPKEAEEKLNRIAKQIQSIQNILH